MGSGFSRIVMNVTDDLTDLENRLRRYRPAGPSPALRGRVLASARKAERRATAPAWAAWTAAAAAAGLFVAATWLTAQTNRLDAQIDELVGPPNRDAVLDVLQRTLGDSPGARAYVGSLRELNAVAPWPPPEMRTGALGFSATEPVPGAEPGRPPGT